MTEGSSFSTQRPSSLEEPRQIVEQQSLLEWVKKCRHQRRFISRLFPSVVSTWCNKSKFPISFPQAAQGCQCVLEVDTDPGFVLEGKCLIDAEPGHSKMGSSCLGLIVVLMFLYHRL